VKVLAAVLLAASSVWAVWGISRTRLFDAGIAQRSRRRETRRLLRRAAVWEWTVALFLVVLDGAAQVPNIIALVGVGVMLWFMPKLIELRGD